MDQRTAHPHRLFRLCAVGLLLLALVGCGSRGGAVAPVDELSERPRDTPASHRVASGETLYSIAFLYGLDFQQVARWNGIRSPYLIRVGQRLRLAPPPRVAEVSSPPPSKSAAAPKRKEPKAADPAPAKRPASAAPAKPSVARAEPKSAPKPAKSSGGSAKIHWRWPTDGKLLSTFSSRKPGRKGVDIGGKRGQPVMAAAAGEVVYSGNGLQRYYGKLIIIKHNDRYLSAYAHNDRLLVKEGEQVKAGQRIAALGDSGTDRPKLHFEIRLDGKPVNPMRYLPKR